MSIELRRIAIVVACATSASCSGPATGPDNGGSASVAPVVLVGAVGSMQQLAFETLEGLSSGDRSRLEAIRLTEFEHNELIYPQLPAAAPEANHPADLAWANIERRNERALGRLRARYEGANLSLLGVECLQDNEFFETFRVLQDCWVSFTVDRDRVEPVQFFRHVLDWGGQYKIFRYYDDD